MPRSRPAASLATVRRTALVAVAVLASVLVPSSANAISYGVPDDGAHPNVGSFVVERTDPTTGDTYLGQLCTGTLIDDDVVLTAAHCMVPLPPGFGDEVWFTLDEVIDADRDGVIDPGVELLTGTKVPHPRFGTTGQNNTYDIAVFLLDEPVTDVAPAEVASLGTLDKASVRRSTFTAVGYGTVRTSRKQGPQGFQVGWRRERADQHLLSLTQAWATFSMNQATGNGGTCYGDSGGPHFLGDVVVAVTVTGDSMCKATDKTYRVDTPWSQDFLGQFVG